MIFQILNTWNVAFWVDVNFVWKNHWPHCQKPDVNWKCKYPYPNQIKLIDRSQLSSDWRPHNLGHFKRENQNILNNATSHAVESLRHRCHERKKMFKILNENMFLFCICSLWTIDLIAKILFYGLLLWAFLSITGLKQHVSWFFSESQGFLKQS